MTRTAIAPVASFLAMGLFWGAWAALVPEVKRVVDAPDGPFGLALLAVGAGSLPAMLVAGRLWTRYGRGVLAVSIIGFGLSSLLPLGITTLPSLALVLLAVGAASGALDVAMNAELSEIEARTGRRLMYGAHAFFSLGVLVASFSTGFVRDAGGDRSVVLPPVAAFFALVALIGLLTEGPGHGAIHVSAPATTGPSTRGWIVALGVLCAGAFLMEDALQSWSALHLERTLGASPALGGAGPGVFAVTMFLGRSSGQLLGRWLSERALVVAGSVATAIGAGIVATATSAPTALVGFAIGGGGVSIVAPALFARAGRLAGPARRGAAISTLTTIGYMGFLVGPGVFGGIAGASSLPTAFLAVSVAALVQAAAATAILRDSALEEVGSATPA
ncbi:MAG TPA: MFS transporter [Candidatus Limnocylindrales bacterium]|nr:MFS transporter [Candidatus Limnocylindrales bacterium]